MHIKYPMIPASTEALQQIFGLSHPVSLHFSISSRDMLDRSHMLRNRPPVSYSSSGDANC
jgi:hypothetical protein